MVKYNNHNQSSPRGFTLMETAITFLLISLLALVAYSFVGSSSAKSAAQSARLSLSSVASAQQVFAAAYGQFTPDPTQLKGLPKNITISSSTSTGPTVVSIAVSDNDNLAMSILGADGVCYIMTVSSLAEGAVPDATESANSCSAASFLPSGETPLPDSPVS